MDDDQLYVKSHVGRDLLQCAAGFQNEKVVAWEYITNGFEYVDPGVNPIVKVFLDNKQKRIVVQDNGRGMSWSGEDGLQNFFVMHGENVDRRAGRRVRGMFGTGKSAAFGIADIFRITTVRNGERCKVELRRQDILDMKSGDPIPVSVLEKSVSTQEGNGTKVEIEGVHLRALDIQGTRQLIERHLAQLPKNITVFVNKQECEFQEPPFDREVKIVAQPPFSQKLGDIELTLKVAKAPLPDELRGVAISSHGNWHASTLAGSEGKEFSQYIFGYLDVPALEDDKSEIPPFDMSRSMRLNPSNELVQTTYAFISREVEKVRRQLAEEERKRKESAEARRLNQEASVIANIINEDFNDFRNRLTRMKAKARGGADVHDLSLEGGESDEDLILGTDIPAEITSDTGGAGHAAGDSSNGSNVPDAGPHIEPADDGRTAGNKTGGSGGRAKPRGGFNVEFRNNGAEAPRAFYDRDIRSIYINLDHPQISAAKSVGTDDDISFRRLSYEVAFAEYAVALQRELVSRGEYLDMDEPLQEVRSTMDRLSRKAAVLYLK